MFLGITYMDLIENRILSLGEVFNKGRCNCLLQDSFPDYWDSPAIDAIRNPIRTGIN